AEGSAAVAGALGVGRRGESALVDVSFVGFDPMRAATLVNTLADVYLAHVATREKEHVQRDLDALDAELPRLAEQRDQARRDLEVFKQENAFLTFDGREELLQEELKQQSRIVQETREQCARLRARRSIITDEADEAGADGGADAPALDDPQRDAIAAALEIEPRREAEQKLIEFQAHRAELAGLQGTRQAQLDAIDAEIDA